MKKTHVDTTEVSAITQTARIQASCIICVLSNAKDNTSFYLIQKRKIKMVNKDDNDHA